MIQKSIEANQDYITAQALIVNGKFHVIGDAHFVYDANEQQLKMVHDFGADLFFPEVIAIQDKMLLFGGIMDSIAEVNKNIYEYDDQWNTLKAKIPIELWSTSCTITQNRQQILLCGGIQGFQTYSRWGEGSASATGDIYIYDIKMKELSRSSITCPKLGIYESTIYYHSEEEQLYLIAGYIKKYAVLNWPVYMNKLVRTFYHKEWLHLFYLGVDTGMEGQDIEYGNGEHWSLDVDEILESRQTV